MADARQDKKQDKSNPSSEGFGFKQSPLGFDKNEVNLYINKLKKQMKEQEIEYKTQIDNMRKNLEDAYDESNAAKSAARDAQQAAANAPAASANPDEIKMAVAEAVKAKDAKIMELRKERNAEAGKAQKFEKESFERKKQIDALIEKCETLRDKYKEAKKASSGGKPVVTSNADEVLDEACKMAEQIIESANAYAKTSIENVNNYKQKVEAELKARSEKLADAKKKLDEQKAKAAAENEAAKNSMKAITEKITAVTVQLGSFATAFDSVNSQITAVTGQIDEVTGQFGNVSKQITEATTAIDGVTKQFGTVSEQINQVSATIGGVTKQFTDVSGKLTVAKDSFGSVSETLTKAKSSFADVTKSVTDTKSGITNVKTSVDDAEKLANETKTGAADTAALASVAEAIDAATAEIKVELNLPEFKPAFDKSKLAELKNKLKVETTYVGGADADDDDDDDDILATIEIDSVPDAPAVVEEMDTYEEPEPIVEEIKAEPAPAPASASKPPIDDDLSDFFMPVEDNTSSSIPLVNTSAVGPSDDFTLEKPEEPDDMDFELMPNDLTAKPDKGSDLGEDIFDMAMSTVDADDTTLDDMIGKAKKEEEGDDFMLTPAEIKDEYKAHSPAYGNDFGEFADLLEAGSAETSAPVDKKKPTFKTSSDDPFDFGMEEINGSDDDMSSDSDFSSFLI